MDKLLETLGKILEKLLSSKTLWTIIVAVAICTTLLTLGGGSLLGLGTFVSRYSTLIRLAALVSICLILAKIVIWIIERIRERYFV